MSLVKPLILDPITKRLRNIKPGETLNAAVQEVDVISLSNGTGGALSAGTPIYISGTDAMAKSRANAESTADVQGILLEDTADAATGTVQTDGKAVLTTAQWDLITGQTGGLTPSSSYYLNSAVAGKLTTTPPGATGEFVTHIGKAVNSTTLDLSIVQGIEL